MKIAGIIAEYHPFHNGHAWQLAEVRRRGFDAVVCVMSTGVVQRGECELIPYPVRVKAALCAGADLVLALPAPYAGKSAEGFAFAAVALLDALGCVDTLCFGTETADETALMRAARVLESPAFGGAMRAKLDSGMTAPQARAEAAAELLGYEADFLKQPNHILGVDYCRALLKNSSIKPLALVRVGAAHDSALQGRHEGVQYASASHLRRLWQQQGVQALAPYVPRESNCLYQQAQSDGLVRDDRAFSTALLSRLRAMTESDMAAVRLSGEGLSNRLYYAVQKASNAEDLLRRLQTKRYPTARLRRLMLDAALGYSDDLPALPPYLHVLGASKAGFDVLKQAAPRLPMGTSLAALSRQNEKCLAVACAHAAAVDFSSLCRSRPQPCGLAYTQPLCKYPGDTLRDSKQE